ncbi:hypothetical protein HMPREF0497_0868 [Lentilactobacillus buchneri ATCC 11577]|nr:hypothetical protein HMPREF0497_0868 [Lentilactobacillus buchneri ATCC 11577]
MFYLVRALSNFEKSFYFKQLPEIATCLDWYINKKFTKKFL